MPPPLILRIIGDASSLLKTNEAATASITSVARTSVAASEKMAAASKASAEAQIAAAVKARRIQEANVVALQRASVGLTGADAAAAAVVVANAQTKLDRSIGITTATTGRFAKETQAAERDLGKVTRGALAGSGAFSAMGRSLAFASGGFLVFASASQAILGSVGAAQELAATTRQVTAQLRTSGKAWDDYKDRITATDLRLSRISGFTNQELLQSFGFLVRVTGNVSTALRLNAVAADVARGRHIALSAASLALGKALGGSVTALRRLGIVIPPGVKGMAALNYVAEKFAGQAQAGATASDRFHAALVNASEEIGAVLLPTFTRLTTSLTAWIQRMTESGKLQSDVNDIVRTAGNVFHALGDAIGVVDKVTGSFVNTMKLLLALGTTRLIIKWVGALERLTVGWRAVEGAATAAAAAETAAGAAATGAAGGAGVGIIGRALGRGAPAAKTATRLPLILPFGGAGGSDAKLLSRIKQYTLNTEAAATKTGALATAVTGLGTAIGGAALAISGVLQSRRAGRLANAPLQGVARPSQFQLVGATAGGASFVGPNGDYFIRDPSGKVTDTGIKKIYKIDVDIGPRLKEGLLPAFLPKVRGVPLGFGQRQPQAPAQRQPFGGALPIPVYGGFQLNIPEQIAQAQAGLTKSLKDDVAVARKIIQRVKRLIDQGKLQGNSLVQGLQAEAAALGTIRDAAQQQAERVKAAAERAIENMIDPLRLEVELSREQAQGRPTGRTLQRMRASAQKAIRSGKLSLEQQKEAWDQIASVNAQLTQTASEFQIPPALQLQLARAQALGQNTTAILYKMLAALRKALASTKDLSAKADLWGQISQITDQIAAAIIPPKLQLALAREQALGQSTTETLLKMRAVLYKALKKAKGNIQLQTEIWQQIGQINDQLASSATSAFGTFRQASTALLTQGLGLTAEQREKLRARLSQLGPGGTVPGEGVGAGGYVIDPETGRPMRGGHTTAGHLPRTRPPERLSQATANKALRMIASGRAFHEDITVKVELDGKVIATSTTRHQQRRRRHNPSQRRGPNAGVAGA